MSFKAISVNMELIGVDLPGRNTVSREDIMDAIEREKYGVNVRQETDDSERHGLTKLFPWLPKPGNKPSSPDDFQGLMGYHTLS